MIKSTLAWLALVLMAAGAAAQTVPPLSDSTSSGPSVNTQSGSGVGIGTTQTLTMDPGDINLSVGQAVRTEGIWDLGSDGSNSTLSLGSIAANRNVAIYTFGTTPAIYANTSGNVGLGTTNPSALLHIVPADAAANDYSTGIRVSRSGSDLVDQYVGLNFAQGVANLVSAGYQDYGYFQFLQRYGTSTRVAMGINNLGNVGIGTTNPQKKLHIAGDVEIDGSLYFGSNGQPQSAPYAGTTCGGDYAESMDVTGDHTNYAPGDLLVLDPDNPGRILKSVESYSTNVAGIYSTKPGPMGRRQTGPKSESEVPMAMVGVVPAKVSAENGAIKIGDLLVTSSMAGYAMKGTDRSRMLGAVVGKAMGSLESGTGVIEVLVTLQ